jgi:hypothetical protein
MEPKESLPCSQEPHTRAVLSHFPPHRFLKSSFNIILAVPWLRRLVAGLSLLLSGFAPGSVYVGFVECEVAVEYNLRVLLFSPVRTIPPWLSILIYQF